MTTNVRLSLEHDPHGVDVHVFTLDKNSKGAPTKSLVTKLNAENKEAVVAVWDSRSIIFEEHPKK
jgi:hypothetical protein